MPKIKARTSDPTSVVIRGREWGIAHLRSMGCTKKQPGVERKTSLIFNCRKNNKI
jgi:hypothetical protein